MRRQSLDVRGRLAPVEAAIEFTLLAALLPLLKRIVPIRSLAEHMWSTTRTAPPGQTDETLAELTRKFSRLARSNCLERSLLAYRFLGRGGFDPQLVLGVADFGAGVVGHAWVTVDGEPFFDHDRTLDAFSPIVTFTANGIPSTMSGELALPKDWL
jgi:hypothetical protein